MNELGAEAGLPARLREPRAWRSPRAWTLLLCLFVGGLAVDLGSKSWAFDTVAGTPVVLDRDTLVAAPHASPIPRHSGQPLLPYDLLEAKLELNPGAVFGIGSNLRWFFVLFTFVALATALTTFARSSIASRGLHVGLALIMAGGLGNLYDRIAFARVRDFLHMLPGHRLPFGWHWPGTYNPELLPWVFNIADLLLLVGMLCVMGWLRRMRAATVAAEAALEPVRTTAPDGAQRALEVTPGRSAPAPDRSE